MKTKPISLRKWCNDEYTKGIFCAKVGLVDYAINNSVKLIEGTDKRKLFDKGVDEADQFELSDIAWEMKRLRDDRPELFDNTIKQYAGKPTLAKVKAAIDDAHDWETDEMRKGGMEVMLNMMRTDSNHGQMNERSDEECVE